MLVTGASKALANPAALGMAPLMGGLLFAVVLAAAPTKVAVVDFTGVKVEPALLGFATTTFAVKLGERGDLQVTTSTDIANALGIERQRQILGCAELSSCTAELAGALGVDAIAAGSLAKLGEQYQLTLRVTNASAAVLTTFSGAAAESGLPALLAEAAASVRARLVKEVATSPAPVILAVAGGGVALVGAVLLGVAAGQYGLLVDPAAPTRFSDAQAVQSAQLGRSLQLVGAVSLGVGLSGALAGLVWSLLQPKPARAASPGFDATPAAVAEVRR